MNPDLTLKIVVAVLVAIGIVALFAVAAPLVRGVLLLVIVLGVSFWYNNRQAKP